MNDSPTLFDAEPRPQHRDPIYLQPRRARRIETIVEPAFLSARISDPATSVEAAKTISDRTTRMIRAALRGGPKTADEIKALPEFRGMYGPTVVSAISRSGAVDSGSRRPSSRGRDQIVWRLAP